MKKTRKFLLALACTTVLFVGCSNKEAVATKEEIAMPSAITIYDKGYKKDVNKDDDRFNAIYEEGKSRATSINDALNIAVDEEKFKLFKDEGISITFKYDKDQILKYTDNDGKEREVLYTELFFPLSDGSLAKVKDDSLTVIAIGKSSEEILVELKSPDKMLEFVNENKAE